MEPLSEEDEKRAAQLAAHVLDICKGFPDEIIVSALASALCMVVVGTEASVDTTKFIQRIYGVIERS